MNLPANSVSINSKNCAVQIPNSFLARSAAHQRQPVSFHCSEWVDRLIQQPPVHPVAPVAPVDTVQPAIRGKLMTQSRKKTCLGKDPVYLQYKQDLFSCSK